MLITFGEILMRLAVPRPHLYKQAHSLELGFGGAEFNVASLLAQWNEAVTIVTGVPDNEWGNRALELLRTVGIDNKFVITKKGRLGIYFLEQGQGLKASKVIYDREGSVFSQLSSEDIDWVMALKDTTGFHFSGISAALSETTTNTLFEGIKAATKVGSQISVDINYRSKLWNYGLSPAMVMYQLLPYCDIIFTGIDAPEHIFGIRPEGKKTTSGILTIEDVVSVFKQLKIKYPKAYCYATTLRNVLDASHHQLQGVLYVNDKVFVSKVWDMPSMVDRVGGGDAFMAGLLFGLRNNADNYEKIVNFATASSVLKHYISGDIAYMSLQDVTEFANNQSTTIKR